MSVMIKLHMDWSVSYKENFSKLIVNLKIQHATLNKQLPSSSPRAADLYLRHMKQRNVLPQICYIALT